MRVRTFILSGRERERERERERSTWGGGRGGVNSWIRIRTSGMKFYKFFHFPSPGDGHATSRRRKLISHLTYSTLDSTLASELISIRVSIAQPANKEYPEVEVVPSRLSVQRRLSPRLPFYRATSHLRNNRLSSDTISIIKGKNTMAYTLWPVPIS